MMIWTGGGGNLDVTELEKSRDKGDVQLHDIQCLDSALGRTPS